MLFTEQRCKHISQRSGGWGHEIQLAKDLTGQAGTALVPVLPMCVELRLQQGEEEENGKP